jgi:site-specific DNA-methyltransferase (cytosine-N4-specific)
MRDKTTDWQQRVVENADGLPPQLASLCRKLLMTLSAKDGFRRQAVPMLIYRYLADMRRVFVGLPKVLHKGARLAFLVGPNHTTLSGERFDIDTPSALTLIASELEFRIKEVIPLQTYQRYALHQKNSIRGETLTIMEWQ